MVGVPVRLLPLLLLRSAAASTVLLENPYQLGNRSSGHFWFPNPITTMPGSGVIVLRINVHADATMSYNVAAMFTSTDSGRSFTEVTHDCGEAHLPGCALPGLAHPTVAWTLSIPQADGRGLLSIPYQPKFTDATQRRLSWNATLLDVSPGGAVTVKAATKAVRLLELPEAVNQTWHDSTDHTLPNCNLYSGSSVALTDHARLALLTNVRWKSCASAANTSSNCWAVVAIASTDVGNTWEYRATVSEADDEAFLLKLGDGRLMAIMRHNFGLIQPGGCQHPTNGSSSRRLRSEAALSVACAFRQSFSTNNGHTWSPYTLMTSSDEVPPHSVMPKALHLRQGGYIMSGGRSGLYLWHCENTDCIDRGQWVTVNLAAHHDATLGKTDPLARMGKACSDEKLWGTRNCPSKGYLGLTELVDEPSGFLVCYDHYLPKPASGMAVYCVRGRVNITTGQLTLKTDGSETRKLATTVHRSFTDRVLKSDDIMTLSAPRHLRFMGYFDRYAPDPPLPAPPVTSAHANFYTDRDLSKVIARFHEDGLPGLVMLMESEYWKGMREGKGKSASPLLAGWEAHVDTFAKAITDAPSGSVVGVQLGDELVCMGLPLSNLSAIAARLRPRLPEEIFLYTNECFVQSRRACNPVKNGTDCAVKNKRTQIPGVHNECRQGFCADRVWPLIPEEIDFISLDSYCRGNKYCNDTADVVGEAASAAAEAQIYLLPLLRPHQRLWVVPGLFGPASVAHSPEARTAYDELLVRKLQGWLGVIRSDTRYVGILGWKWPSMNSIAPEYALGAAAFPKLQAALAQAKPPPLNGSFASAATEPSKMPNITIAGRSLFIDNLPFIPSGFVTDALDDGIPTFSGSGGWPVRLSEREATHGLNVVLCYIFDEDLLPNLRNESFWAATQNWLDRAAAVGMRVMWDLSMTVGSTLSRKPQLDVLKIVLGRLIHHPAILLWYTADEPDGNGYPSIYCQQLYDTIKAVDDRPVAMTFNTVVFIANEAPGVCHPPPCLKPTRRWWAYLNATDIILTDIYPIGTPPGRLQCAPDTVSFAPYLQGPCNFSKLIADSIDELVTKTPKPVWFVPQAVEHSARLPSVREERVMVMTAIAHGATGVLTFAHDPNKPHNVMASDELWSESYRLARELAELANVLAYGVRMPRPVITTIGNAGNFRPNPAPPQPCPTYKTASACPVRFCTWTHSDSCVSPPPPAPAFESAAWNMPDGSVVVLLVNLLDQPSAIKVQVGTGKHNNSTCGYVLFEQNRFINVGNRGGANGGILTFEDMIGAMTSSVYLLGPRASEDVPVNADEEQKTPLPGSSSGFIWNGGMEASVQASGRPDGFSLSWGSDAAATATSDPRLSHSGDYSLRLITPSQNGGIVLQTTTNQLTRGMWSVGKHYRLSVWVVVAPSSSVAGIRLRFSLMSNGDTPQDFLQGGSTIVVQIKPSSDSVDWQTNDWQQLNIEGVATKLSEEDVTVHIELLDQGTIWVDDLSLVLVKTNVSKVILPCDKTPYKSDDITSPPPKLKDDTIVAHRVLLSHAVVSGARALDGSPPLYYFTNATSGASAQKFHIYLEGGGWCQSEASCAKRSTSILGSSSEQFHISTVGKCKGKALCMVLPTECRCDGGGYFSSDPVKNPLMHDWNHVFVNYLDGGSFAGNASTPIQYNSTQKLFYSGRKILDAVLSDLLHSRGMNVATDVVMSGCSAGGLAIYLNADHVAGLLPPSAKFRVLADSGYFRREAGNVPGMQWVATAMQLTTNKECEMAMVRAGKDKGDCVFAEIVAPFIQTKLFALQSIVDHDQVGNLPKGGGRCCANCSSQQGVNEFAERLNTALHDGLFSGPLAHSHGGFIDTCVHHCGSWAGDGSEHVLEITINGTTAGSAFQQWYEGTVPADTVWQQPVPTPSSPRCGACCHPQLKTVSLD